MSQLAPLAQAKSTSVTLPAVLAQVAPSRHSIVHEEKMLRALPGASPGDESTLEGAVEAVKRRMIVNALQSEGNKVAAAKKLGISRSYLHKLINEYNI
jgi:DNA-binding NtrC family response regulator